MLGLCWDEFKCRHLPNGFSDGNVTATGARQFLNCVQGILYIDKATNEYVLTTVGEQALRATQEAR